MEVSDEKVDTSIKNVSIGNKKITTPFKSFSRSGSDGIVEISAQISNTLLEKAYNGISNLDNLPKKCKSNSINTIIPLFMDAEISDKYLSVMENRIHPLSDIVVVPRWEGILSAKRDTMLAEDLWDVSYRYIEEVRKSNGKLIMGNIPLNKPQSVVEYLLNHYLKEGITSFILDYGGCKVLNKSFNTRNISKILEDHTDDGDYLLYSVNMRKSHDYEQIMPADDFLSFSNCCDIMGNYHLRGGGNPTVVKCFSRNSWTYDKVQVNADNTGYKYTNEHLMNSEMEGVKAEIIENGTALDLMKRKPGAKEYTIISRQHTLFEIGFDVPGMRWD